MLMSYLFKKIKKVTKPALQVLKVNVFCIFLFNVTNNFKEGSSSFYVFYHFMSLGIFL